MVWDNAPAGPTFIHGSMLHIKECGVNRTFDG